MTTRLRRVGRSVRTAGWILLVVTGWVAGLALVFLATGWPRWAFYAAVVLGTLLLVQVAAPRPTTDRDDRAG